MGKSEGWFRGWETNVEERIGDIGEG